MPYRTHLIVVTLLVLATAVLAQSPTTPVIASPNDQARIKPLVQAETEARKALNAKIATLPESKAYKDAEEALKKAGDALNKAAESLPENAAWKSAGAKVLDEAYRIQAAHSLSSREYRPELNDKGDLVFARIALPK